MAAIKLAAALIYRVATGAWPQFGRDSIIVMLAATLLSTAVLGQSGEELGWRGYALPRLAARFGLGGASVILGLAWATWHLPLFYLHGAVTFGQSFPVYLAQVTALSVALAWLYWRTGGSLLLTMLMHAAINNTKDIVPSIPRPPMNPLVPTASLVAWLGMTLLSICAAYFLIRMRRARIVS
jgi:membrane protease YdiL (CAAX protease family)